MHELPVELSVNGRPHSGTVEPRLTLADFLREKCGLTGTHLGCEHGACGACTVLLDGQAVRSCLVFAVQAEGQEVTTVADEEEEEARTEKERGAEGNEEQIQILTTGMRNKSYHQFTCNNVLSMLQKVSKTSLFAA